MKISKLVFLAVLACFSMHCHCLIAVEKYIINHLGLDHTNSRAYCINNQGFIAGVFDIPATKSSPAYKSSFYWSEKTGIIELVFGEGFTPYDMNDNGKIIGVKDSNVKFPDGKYRAGLSGFMNSIDGECEFKYDFSPRSINNDNHAVGINNTRRPYSPLIKYEGQKPIPFDFPSIGVNFFQKLRAEKMGNIIHYIPVVINNKNEVLVQMIIKTRFQDLGYSFISSENGPRHFVFFNGYAAMDMNDNTQVILTTDFTKDPASWISEHGSVALTMEFKELMKYPSSWFWENGSYKHMWNGGKALAINNHAVAVGFTDKGAVIWNNGETNYLFDLLKNPDGWELLADATDINDRGEIVGSGIYKGKQTAFLLTPCE